MDHPETELKDIRRLYPYILCGILLLAYRIWINFSHELIPGINGGYYPVQIRSVLEQGRLGFPDMPLYFYLNALLVKLIGLFGQLETEQVILGSSKVLDSLSLPLLLVPLYQIGRDLTRSPQKELDEWIIVAFSTLSVFPLMLVSEAQKNAFALPLMGFFLLFFLRFLHHPSVRHILMAALFLVLTGLTHFGVFAVSLTLLLIGIIIRYGKKSLVFLAPITFLGIGLVWLFDPARAESIFWLSFTLFRDHIFRGGGPVHLPVILYLVSSLVFMATGLFVLLDKKATVPHFDRKMLITLLIISFILSFPVIGEEYLLRFSLILFLPQSLLLILLFRYLKGCSRMLIRIFTIMMVLLSIWMTARERKTPILSGNEVEDLHVLKKRISSPESTLIVARHGLEWWANWFLETSVGQESALDEQTFGNYDQVIILVQKNAKKSLRMTHHHFPEPLYPPDATVFYDSNHFLAVVLGKEQFLRRPPPSSRQIEEPRSKLRGIFDPEKIPKVFAYPAASYGECAHGIQLQLRPPSGHRK